MKHLADSRDTQDSRDSRDSQDSLDTRDSRDTQDSLDTRDSPDSLDSLDSVDTRDGQDSRDSQDSVDTVSNWPPADIATPLADAAAGAQAGGSDKSGRMCELRGRGSGRRYANSGQFLDELPLALASGRLGFIHYGFSRTLVAQLG